MAGEKTLGNCSRNLDKMKLVEIIDMEKSRIEDKRKDAVHTRVSFESLQCANITFTPVFMSGVELCLCKDVGIE